MRGPCNFPCGDNEVMVESRAGNIRGCKLPNQENLQKEGKFIPPTSSINIDGNGTKETDGYRARSDKQWGKYILRRP